MLGMTLPVSESIIVLHCEKPSLLVQNQKIEKEAKIIFQKGFFKCFFFLPARIHNVLSPIPFKFRKKLYKKRFFIQFACNIRIGSIKLISLLTLHCLILISGLEKR